MNKSLKSKCKRLKCDELIAKTPLARQYRLCKMHFNEKVNKIQKHKNSVRNQCKFCGKTIANKRNNAFCNYNCWQLSFWCTKKITKEILDNFFAEINHLFPEKKQIKYQKAELLLNLERMLLNQEFINVTPKYKLHYDIKIDKFLSRPYLYLKVESCLLNNILFKYYKILYSFRDNNGIYEIKMFCTFEVIEISMCYALLSKHIKVFKKIFALISKHWKRINKKDLTYLDKVEEYLELLKYCINYLNDNFNTQLPNYFNSKENILIFINFYKKINNIN
jgi:hypothetical protein